MTSTDTIAVHRRYNDEIINQGDLDLVDTIFTPDHVDHFSGEPDIHGTAGLKQFLGMFRRAFPDTQFTVGIAIHRFAGAQIQESWDCYDALGLLQQLGAVPPSGPATG